jgi:hypothetical protein
VIRRYLDPLEGPLAISLRQLCRRSVGNLTTGGIPLRSTPMTMNAFASRLSGLTAAALLCAAASQDPAIGGGVTQRLERPSAPSMPAGRPQLTPVASAVRDSYFREFGEVIPIPAIFNDERAVDCLKRGHLTTTAYLKQSAKRSTLLEMYLSRDGTRVLSKRRVDVLTPAGTFKVVVVIVRHPATVGDDALDQLGAAQRQINEDHAAFARAHGYKTPIVQFDNTNVIVDPSEIGDPHKPANVRAAAIRAGATVDGSDFVIVLDPDPLNFAGGLATPPNGDVYVGNFGRWTATLRSPEWISIARTAYHHEVAHHWGWMHDWTPTCGGTKLGFEPFLIAPILAGWEDVDGNGVPEVLEKNPYGRPR